MLRSPKLDALLARRLLVGCVTAMLTTLVLLGILAQPAEAQNRMTVTSETTFFVDVENREIRVEGVYELHNTIPPRDVGDGRTERTYFTDFSVVIPNSVAQYEARINDLRVPVNYEEKDGYVLATSEFADRLHYPAANTLRVNYVIPDSGPRPAWGDAEISDEFLAMTVWAQGTSGRTAVRVIMPADYEVELTDDIAFLTDSERNGFRILEAYGIGDPIAFNGRIRGYNEGISLVETPVSLHAGRATIVSRQSDTEWREFVTSALLDDLPVLEELVGIPWPHDHVRIEQSSEPRRDGFGGWYETSGNVIKFDNANREVLLHELTHGWFNREFAYDRWIIEGLAEEIASRAIEATGGPRPDPTEPNRNDRAAIPLIDWRRVDSVDTDEEARFQSYQYNASWWVFRQISDDIGVNALSDVIAEFQQTADPRDQIRNYYTLFDLLEPRMDTEKLETLFETYLLPAGANAFERRNDVHARYDALFATTEIEPPRRLEQTMRLWLWGDASTLINSTERIIPKLEQLELRAAELSIDVSRFFTRFDVAQDAPGLVVLREDIDEALEQLETIDVERREIIDMANVLDVSVSFDETLVRTIAGENARLRDMLDQIAVGRIAVTGAAAQAGIAISFETGRPVADAAHEVQDLHRQIDRYRERSSALEKRMRSQGLVAPPITDARPLAAAHKHLDEVASAMASLKQAQDAMTEPTMTERIGLIGDDRVGTLDAARRAFESGDYNQAIAHADAAQLASLTASEDGKGRLLLAGLVVIGLSFVVVTTSAVRRHQRQQVSVAAE